LTVKEGGVERTMFVPYNSPLLGIADESVAQRLADEVKRSTEAGRVATASSLLAAGDSFRLRFVGGRGAG
jgi:hypothetical protein